jgi:hypothetical protein
VLYKYTLDVENYLMYFDVGDRDSVVQKEGLYEYNMHDTVEKHLSTSIVPV